MKKVRSGNPQWAIDVAIIGGGMITNDVLLPSIYHLQRLGVVGNINICGRSTAPLKALKNNRELKEAFPKQDFAAYPPLSESAARTFPNLYKTVIASLRPYQAVVVAVPTTLIIRSLWRRCGTINTCSASNRWY